MIPRGRDGVHQEVNEEVDGSLDGLKVVARLIWLHTDEDRTQLPGQGRERRTPSRHALISFPISMTTT
jgi:hypothetical protein